MRHRDLTRAISVLSIVSLACGSETDLMDPGDVPLTEGVTVMTQNLYVGAALDPGALTASPSAVPFIAAELYNAVLESQFPARAAAIARQVRDVDPHVIALQEVSLIRIQSPGDFATGGTQPATNVALDFLTILFDALEDEELNYSLSSLVENADVEVPMFTSTLSLDDIRLTDFDAILVRDDVQQIESTAESFAALLEFAVGSDTLAIRRGFAAVTAEIDDQRYNFVSTHLEPADATVRQDQTAELVNRWENEPLPVVLMGDFNSPAPAGPSYQALVQADYQDAWVVSQATSLGLTCCQAADLRNEESALTQRIDLVLVRNPAMLDTLLVVPRADVIGEESNDRTPGGLWPSDHAGVWAQLLVRR